ncbi:MAG: cytochrome c oxidase subunit 4 [Candidatus Nanopelagicales bacterium]|nr:cytochrome c oxidase subunit 4 [Actinomycetota bacterium]HNL52020.1 cytochrome c oxidase subunit 4 [Actinomycetota bacterium]HNO15898.1 cytochrome c oxidase subunit 4 [Actinomycetota bacterium]HUM86257.1 cytochrome c oxidase subunit 4 [Actinomycetota bacterium]
MKESGYIWGLGTIFFAVVAVVYGVWSQDWAGTTALAFTGFMTALVAFYSLYTARRLDNRPEDDQMAEQEEADPDYGFFSPHSWWPLPLGASAMMIALGLIFATWLMIAGVVFLVLSTIGLVFEYYRGDFAH